MGTDLGEPEVVVVVTVVVVVEEVGQEQEQEEGEGAREGRRQKRRRAPEAAERRRNAGTAIDLVGEEVERRAIVREWRDLEFDSPRERNRSDCFVGSLPIFFYFCIFFIL